MPQVVRKRVLKVNLQVRAVDDNSQSVVVDVKLILMASGVCNDSFGLITHGKMQIRQGDDDAKLQF